MFGHHTVKAWSATQAVLALSSGEAEFYALVKTASQGLGLKAMLKDYGIKVERVGIKTDASAAKGIAMRRGLGPVRHIEVGQLWIQDKVHDGEIRIEKVEGNKNLADLLTKHADTQSLETHVNGVGISPRGGRHVEAPEVAGNEVIEKYVWGNEQTSDLQLVDGEPLIGNLSCMQHFGSQTARDDRP